MSDADTLIRAAWSYAAGGAETPALAMKPGGNGPALVWTNGAYLYLNAFGEPVTEGTPPGPPQNGGKKKHELHSAETAVPA